jgi:AcrR family transcriptional regulator
MPTLTERRRDETRTAIADAAVRLFIERGFAETTMDDVADAAGVSRRTAYRHFPTKDDLVFEQPRRWLARFDAEIERRTTGEDMRQRCRRGVLAVARSIDATSSSVLAAYSVFRATPSLRGANGRLQDQWVERLVELFTPSRPPSAGRALQLATVAGALVGAATILVAVWADAQPGGDIVAMTTAALDQLDPIWPDWLIASSS